MTRVELIARARRLTARAEAAEATGDAPSAERLLARARLDWRAAAAAGLRAIGAGA